MKIYFYNSKKEEIFKILHDEVVSQEQVKFIYQVISDNLNKSQVIIDIINGNQVYTVVRQYYKSKPIEFEITDRIPDNGCSINDSIINYIKNYNDISYHYNNYNQLVIVIKEIKYNVNTALYGNELLIDLVPVNGLD